MLDQRCLTCRYWHPGNDGWAAAPEAGFPDIDHRTGTCETGPPDVVVVRGVAAAYWPVTHASRGCVMWAGHDEPDDPAREDHPDDVVVSFDRRAA